MPARVLVIDLPESAVEIGRTLIDDGHRVVAVSSVEDALARATREHFDLILLDPLVGGAETRDLLDELRHASPFAEVQVLVMSDDASLVVADRYRVRGAAGYLVKPFAPDGLRERIGRLCAA